MRMASRSRNTATCESLAKALRCSLRGLEDKSYLDTDLDAIAGKYEAALRAILEETLRPSVRLLARAAKEAFQVTEAEGKVFAERMCACITHIRTKHRQATSGKKLSSPVQRLVLLVRQVEGRQSEGRPSSSSLDPHLARPRLPCKLGDSLKRKARELLRKSSGASSVSSEVRVRAKVPASAKDILAGYGVEVAMGPPSSPIVLESSSEFQGGDSGSTGLSLAVPPSRSGGSARASSAASGLAAASGEEAPGEVAGGEGYKQYLDSGLLALVRLYKDHTMKVASMSPGPDGFAIASFDDQEGGIVTELPNVLLSEVPAAGAGGGVGGGGGGGAGAGGGGGGRRRVLRKKPAAVSKEANDEEELGEKDPEEEEHQQGEEEEEERQEQEEEEEPEQVVEALSPKSLARRKKNEFSRAYHRRHKEALREGLSDLEAKDQARAAGRAATAQL